MLSLDCDGVERAASERIDEEALVEPVDHELGLVHRVEQHVELATVDTHRGRRVVGGSSRDSRDDGRRRRRGPRTAGGLFLAMTRPPCRAGGRRRCRAPRRASSRTGRARGRSGAGRRCRHQPRRHGRGPRAWRRRRAANTRSSRNCRNGVARSSARQERGGVVAPHVSRDPSPRAGRRPRAGSRSAAPTRTTSPPRSGRRRRSRRRAPPCAPGSCRIWKWSSASAVPHVATAFGDPASANAITSV